MHTLGELCRFLRHGTRQLDAKDLALELERITDSSALTGPKAAFVARKGGHGNGLDYLDEIRRRGCRVLICPADNPAKNADVHDLLVLNLPRNCQLAMLACWFYGMPSSRLGLLGVTGTNGKTTVTQLLAQWLTLMGRRCGVIGTLGSGFLPDLKSGGLTTPGCFALQEELNTLCTAQAEYCALEVSSIGVVTGRLNGCECTAGGFTNLTRDHLDFHGTMEEYTAAKDAFLRSVPGEYLTVNLDDAHGRELSAFQPRCMQVCHKAVPSAGARALLISHPCFEDHGVSCEVNYGQESGHLNAPLLGGFNIQNLALTLGMLLTMHQPLRPLLELAPQLKPVRGRLERFMAPGKPVLIVDYAHTPDGVEQALKALREHYPKSRLWCVLGCGGDRDRGKRPLMAIAAAVYADEVVLTSDNPRSEDPAAIIADMRAGLPPISEHVVSIIEREEAIRHAFTKAAPGDVILVAGKGHEDYQIFASGTVHYSDRELCAALVDVPCP